jgi:hypothetical protein
LKQAKFDFSRASLACSFASRLLGQSLGDLLLFGPAALGPSLTSYWGPPVTVNTSVSSLGNLAWCLEDSLEE